MATVRHLGLFPWCPFPDRQAVIDEYFFGNTNAVTSQLNHYEGLKTSIEDAVALYWRVKSWRIQGSFEASSGVEIQTVSFDGTVTRFNTERDLICAEVEGEGDNRFFYVPPFSTYNFETNIIGVAGPVTFSVFFSLHWLPFAGLPLTYKRGFGHRASQDELFTWVSFDYSENISGDFSYVALRAGPIFEGEETSIPISFLGKQYEIKSLKSDAGGLAECSITATEYWPYDPGDGGGPIYDSATGAQLRDFPAR
jgi:hypothetical protein